MRSNRCRSSDGSTMSPMTTVSRSGSRDVEATITTLRLSVIVCLPAQIAVLGSDEMMLNKPFKPKVCTLTI